MLCYTVTLVFGSFLLIGFLLVGVIGGWVARDYMLNYQESPQVHPEMFDQNGNLVPDEIVVHLDLKTIMTTTKKTTKTKAVKTVMPRSSTSIPTLPNNPFVFEVLDAASKQRSKAKKVEVLQRYTSLYSDIVCVEL